MSFVTRSFLHSIAAARPSSPECVGLDADPDDDGDDGLAFEADSNKVHAHGIEDVVDLKSKLVLPDLPEGSGYRRSYAPWMEGTPRGPVGSIQVSVPVRATRTRLEGSL
jgi:hypothetical protein